MALSGRSLLSETVTMKIKNGGLEGEALTVSELERRCIEHFRVYTGCNITQLRRQIPTDWKKAKGVNYYSLGFQDGYRGIAIN